MTKNLDIVFDKLLTAGISEDRANWLVDALAVNPYPNGMTLLECYIIYW